MTNTTDPRDSSRQSLLSQSISYSGPVPPASEMEKLAVIDPQLPARIMAMAEFYQKTAAENLRYELETNRLSDQHQRDVAMRQLDNQATANNIIEADRKRGKSLGFLSFISMCLVCSFGIYRGYPIESVALLVTAMVVAIVALITGKQEKQRKIDRD